jgi:hypothetical protein
MLVFPSCQNLALCLASFTVVKTTSIALFDTCQLGNVLKIKGRGGTLTHNLVMVNLTALSVELLSLMTIWIVGKIRTCNDIKNLLPNDFLIEGGLGNHQTRGASL